jgi:hypothetical protein
MLRGEKAEIAAGGKQVAKIGCRGIPQIQGRDMK